MSNNRINVLWLIKGLGSGGAENLLASAAMHVDRERFNYSAAYFLPWKNALVKDLEANGIPVVCLNQRKPYDMRAWLSLRKLLINDRIDILHAHLPYSGIAGRVVSKFSPVKSVVYSEHNVWERYRRLTHFANKMTFNWNDAVVAVSKSVEDSIREGKNINNRTNLQTIVNGVDVDQLSTLSKDSSWLKAELGIPSTHQIITNVANFTPKKRHTDLLKVGKLVLADRPETAFVLVGQGPLLDEIKQEAKEMGIHKSVFFTGLREDAREIIAASDIFMLSSQFEGMPISVLEAMAVRTPVISTRVGGLPEMMVESEEGILTDAGQYDQLASSAIALLGDANRGRVISEKAFARVRDNFDVRNMVRKTEQLYLELTSERLLGELPV